MSSKLRATKDFFESKGYFDSDQLLSDEGRKKLKDMGGDQAARSQAWQSEGLLNKAKRFGSDIFKDDVNEIKDPTRKEKLKNILNRK